MIITRLIILATFLTQLSGHSAQAKGLRPKQVSTTGTAAFVDSFGSIEELLNGLLTYKLINIDEKAAVQDLLRKNKIEPSLKLLPGKISSDKLNWKSIALRVSPTKGEVWLNGEVVVRSKENVTFDRIFKRVLERSSRFKTSGLIHLMLESAHAGVTADIFETISAAAYAGTYHSFKTVYTGVQGVGAVGMNGFGFPLEWTLVGLRNLIYKGTVVCQGARYVVHGGFKSTEWKNDFDQWKVDHALLDQTSTGKFEGALNGYSANVTAAFMAGGELLGSAFSPERSGDVPVETSLLNSVWPSGVPSCTSESAATLEAYLKEKARVLNLAIQNESRNKPMGDVDVMGNPTGVQQ